MGIMVYSLLWVVQDFVHQPYMRFGFCAEGSYHPEAMRLKAAKYNADASSWAGRTWVETSRAQWFDGLGEATETCNVTNGSRGDDCRTPNPMGSSGGVPEHLQSCSLQVFQDRPAVFNRAPAVLIKGTYAVGVVGGWVSD